jgi:hypothetical protein
MFSIDMQHLSKNETPDIIEEKHAILPLKHKSQPEAAQNFVVQKHPDYSLWQTVSSLTRPSSGT